MPKKFTCLSLLLCLYSSTTFAQKTINGYISEKNSGERLINAFVLAPYVNKGTTSNNYGYFSLVLPTDTATLIFSYAGYKPYQVFWESGTASDSTFAVGLVKQTDLEEVIITSSRIQKNVEQTQMSKISVPIELIKKMPKFLGEADILKSLQMLPGVSQGIEGTTGVIVRGGTPDQNLILLDGTPVYNASHLFGIFSNFNASSIKNVDLYKGGFPARYGGRLSSVIDIVLKDGDKNKFHGEGGIGILATNLQFEGPIKKGKSSFIISGRRSYADIIAQPFIKGSSEESGIDKFFAYFYDFNLKLNFDLTKKDKLFFSTYSGDDMLKVKTKYEDRGETEKISTQVGWGNFINTIRWNHIFKKNLFANTIVNYTRYRFLTNLSQSLQSASTNETFFAKYISGIYDVGAKIDFDYRPSATHSVKFGVGVLQHTFTPGATTFKQTGSGSTPLDTAFNNKRQNSIELSGYIEDDIAVSENLQVNVGVHLGAFQAQTKTYPNIQPRISARYMLDKTSSIKSTYTKMYQYIHLLTNNGTSLPTDLWVPSTDKIKPMKSNQFALGYVKNIKNKYELTIEGYYKDMIGVIEYKDGAGFLNSTTEDWDTKVEQGNGKSYGTEFLIQKTAGRTTGWIGYTLNWSNRTFKEINEGKTFWYKYDRRHDFEITVTHKLSKRWDCSANFIYQTPTPFTLPTGQFAGINETNPYSNYNYNNTYNIYEGRNEFRLLPYHRMDVSITYHKQKKRYEKSWNLSIYNVYNRQNPFFYELTGQNSTGKTTLNGYPLIPLLPTLSYGFKF